ncbi:MAG: YihA family ribosome biogenesis GTP-binding protein [Bacteroidales bacterium]|nr:YihA family ribosome biogenesis GTP-binding protein [Bacteroidales bacterium]
MKITEAKFAGSSARIEGRPQRRLLEFAFIGRSNVGKSSLINLLCGNRKLAMTSATPGKTKVVNHFLVNDSWYLVDLPGYGYARLPGKLRDALKTMISDYVLRSEELVQLFVLLDSRHDLQKADREFITFLGENGIPFALVYTKADKLGPEALKAQMQRNEAALLEQWESLPPVFVTSSSSGKGREEILDYIQDLFNQHKQ